MQDARQGNAARRASRAAGKSRSESSGPSNQAMHQYQTALQWMQEGKFDKALGVFGKLAADGPPELLERARVYLAVCQRNASRGGLTFSNAEEQYDYAVSLLNTGDYGEAREHFEQILKRQPEADYALYGLAVLESITGQVEDCLEHLARAIELNPQNRIQARSDADFQDMADDPRFTELLYPEVS